MNKFFIGLLVIIAGGVFGWYYFNGGASKSVNNNAMTGPSTVTETGTPAGASGVMEETKPVTTTNVSYSDSGFSPAKITVKKGTAVTFTNQSAGKMWVASDVHPTHLLLPGFDQFKGENKGATYTYIFGKVGTWTYHNHESPTMTGTVIVTE